MNLKNETQHFCKYIYIYYYINMRFAILYTNPL